MNIEFLDELYRIKYSYIEQFKKAETDIDLPIENSLDGRVHHKNRIFKLEQLAIKIQEHNELIKKYVELK